MSSAVQGPGDMPSRLTFRAALVLVAVGRGLAFGPATLAAGGALAAKSSAQRGPGAALSPKEPAVEVRLAAAVVPPLREPMRPPKRRVLPRTPIPAPRPAPTPASGDFDTTGGKPSRAQAPRFIERSSAPLERSPDRSRQWHA